MRKILWLRCFEEIIVNSWWLILCILIGRFVYDRAIGNLHQEEQRLKSRVTYIQGQILRAEEKQKELRLHIQHWDDPLVIEAALIQRLGLVPKGYTKVSFFSPEDTNPGT
ncbi:hypothetical protein CP10139811_0017 [Chlamydia ibidis]|uniref:Septum formation initiator family protein n=2 Tax=Chlamydia ibidis TaxID=1405396 RepID=S7J653_9CHLA|nr:hypothetical protein [Chlamydia ibidis]EPP35652.1 hypothetical protein CP10139811_0017 [Chlamydia ibidis]EQM62790.1 hypothetical protein H359_0462 [Chlamydia ibidis 10-1398/6]